MTQADSVLSTPPTNTSAIDNPMMFPPRDPTRRRFLATVASASVISVGSLAASAIDRPIVHPVLAADPIYAVIEAPEGRPRS